LLGAEPYRRDVGGFYKLSQMLKFYDEKYLPLLEEVADTYEQCVLTYRFIVSLLEFVGLRYVGVEK